MTDTRPPRDRGASALGLMMVLHLVCCGAPILILAVLSAGLTLDRLWGAAPYLAVVGAVIGVAWLVWYARRRCWTCSTCDTNATDHRQHAREDRVRTP